jgi:hypothetical protein
MYPQSSKSLKVTNRTEAILRRQRSVFNLLQDRSAVLAWSLSNRHRRKLGIFAGVVHAAGQSVDCGAPFTNMSSDPEQEYFADGIRRDIITAPRASELSRSSLATRRVCLQGAGGGCGTVARDLGVRHVLKAVCDGEQRERVTAQLDRRSGRSAFVG